MEWEIEYNEDDKIIRIKTEGVLDTESEEKLRADVFNWIKRHNCFHLLLDHRQIKELKISTTGIYEIPKKYIIQNIPHNIKIAMLVPEAQLRDFKFYETVSNNSGYVVMLFTEIETAAAWLKK